MDVWCREGLLATTRVYFADKANYYIGQSQYIPVYETAANMVFINGRCDESFAKLSF
jgi:hypothetical protein